MSKSALPFTSKVLGSFAPCKELRQHESGTIITSLDFDDSGQWCVSAGTDETVQLYDCRRGVKSRSVPSYKYGAHLARFVHRSTDVIFASTKGDDTLRYVSLQENRFVRYFKGHKNKVTGVEVSPVDDTLLSTGLDRSLRLWDLRKPDARGILTVRSQCLAAFDATGLVFVVASQDLRTVALYDTRNYERAPFLTFKCEAEGTWQKLELSNNGKHLLIATDGPGHTIHNAMTGAVTAIASGFTPMQRAIPSTSPAAFSLDGNYLFGGTGDDAVAMWNLNDLKETDKVPKLEPEKMLPTNTQAGLLAFSSKLMLMATADSALHLWIPE